MKQLPCAAPYAHQPRGRLVKISLILVLAAASLAPAASATERQDETQAAHRLFATTPTDPGDENWTTGFNQRGLDGLVLALAVDSANAAVYAGGHFWTAGAVSVDYVAKWDALTASWSPLGTGTAGDVNALVIDGVGNLYAGGPSYVAKWDGTTWTPLGDRVNGVVDALALDNTGRLFAGGEFDTIGGVSASSIATWDGATWSPLGSGVNGGVKTLALDHAGSLYAGGKFTAAGGVGANNIARWDGAAWSALGDGLPCDYGASVSALAVDGANNLYAGGGFRFTTAGGVSVNYIAKWDGATWSALGSGMNNPVDALAVDEARAEVYEIGRAHV